MASSGTRASTGGPKLSSCGAMASSTLSLRFPLLVNDSDDDASLHTSLPPTPTPLDERFQLPRRATTRSTSSTISHSGHSIVVRERAHAPHLATASPTLIRRFPELSIVASSISLALPRSRSSSCLPFDDLFVEKITCNIAPPLPPRKAVPLTEQQFMKTEQCLGLNDSDDDDNSLFYTPNPSVQSSSIQGFQEQVQVGHYKFCVVTCVVPR
ncbi:hypothetical protein F5146DRAFT_1201879 [Armillaria mellea]|nr:hypothetical protein F5146DRAFT_1201879 [Armillaria mellea]